MVDIADTITFQADTVPQARVEFERSVDEYLAWCAEVGRTPAKPCSGRFVFRTTPERHRQIVKAARDANLSLNAWLERAVGEALASQHTPRGATPPTGVPPGAASVCGPLDCSTAPTTITPEQPVAATAK